MPEALGAINPLRRVPALICDDGVALMESHLILDYLDGLVESGTGAGSRIGQCTAQCLADLRAGLRFGRQGRCTVL